MRATASSTLGRWPTGTHHNTTDGLNLLQRTYADVRFAAWRGKTLVLGYPHFFPLSGGSDWWSSGC